MNIAILGGTFNPIHLGHIAMAEHILHHTDMEKICFLPNGLPPHKIGNIAPKQHRLKMVEIATEYNPDFYVSDYEINQDKTCYTIDTIKHFNSLDSNQYHFIIGADSLFNLSLWKDAEELKKICSFIICDRGENSHTATEVEKLRQSGCRIFLASMKKIDIDSTSIREKIKKGLDTSNCLQKEVAQYIEKHKLYI